MFSEQTGHHVNVKHQIGIHCIAKDESEGCHRQYVTVIDPVNKESNLCVKINHWQIDGTGRFHFAKKHVRNDRPTHENASAYRIKND